MADTLEQTKDLFSVDDFNEDDISDKSKITRALENPFGEFRPKEEIIEKAKATGTGLLTGTLGIPSDAATLASAVSSGMAKYADSPTAMMLKDVLKKAEKDVGRPAFDKWFTETTGLESNPENVDQLVGEVLSPTGAFLAPGKTLKNIFAPLKKGVTDFFDKMPPPDSGLATVNNAPVSSIEETSKLLDKTKTTKPIETSAPIIPESEFVNAKPTINPIFAGEGTETGKKQAAKFRELEAENKYTPEELFLQTRVYRGDDGQLRWEISTADAKLKSSWEKSLNFEDEFLGITVPEKADGFYDGRASMQLSQILDFPTAYKEYYDVKGVPKYFDDVQTKTREIMSETQLSPLRNLQVYWERGDRYDNTLGYYTPNRDRITLNVRQLKAAARQTAEDYGLPFEEAFKLQVESTLLHEVQHAVQVREGFRMGGDSDNFLPENFDALVSTNKYKKDRILLDIEDQFDIAIQDIAKKDASYNSLAVRNKILNEVEADFNTIYDVLVHKKTNSVDKYKNKSVEELNSIYKKADERLKNKFSTFKDYIYSQDIDRMKLGLLKNAEENVKLTNIDKEATNKYYNLYGEREARLVQKRLEDRFKLNKLGGVEVAKEVESDTKFLSAKGDTDTRGRKLGQMGGFPADTKITKTKLMADGTTFHSSIIEFPQNPSKAKRKFDLEKTKARRAKASKLEDEQLKIQNMKIAEAHAPMVKLLGAEETTKVANNPPTLNADGTGFTENSLVFKNLSDRYTEEALSVVNPEITWIKIPEIYKQKPFQKYKDGDILRNAEGKTVKIELTSFLPVTDKKLYNNPNVVNVSALGKNINKKQYHVEPTYILGDGKYVRLTDLERVGYKKVGKPDLSLISDTKKMNKGGDMNKQMEMFEDGGLKQEGGTVDPVSGNDVPPGSTQEEVRDDIPAQLSEGEFVFPADVVRYIGLEKLMQLRQEAKQGLKQMEEMGQMGNSEEATMPDDLPFDETDLDIEDEEEYNNDTQEMNQGGMVRVGGMEIPRPRVAGQQMAEGGVVKAQSGTFVAPGTGVTTIPSQFAGQNLPSYKPTETIQSGTSPAYTVPMIPATQTGYDPKFMTGPEIQTGQVAPSFQNLVGRRPGQYDEFREYVNDAGMRLQIPFKDGQPIYPIPEGYKFVDPEEEQTETPTLQTTQTKTTRTTGEGGDDTGSRVGTTMVGKTGIGITDKSLTQNQRAGIVMSALDKATDKGKLGKALGVLGTSMVPGVGLAGALAGQQLGFDPMAPDRTALDDVLGQYGYDAKAANAALNDPMASVGFTQQQAIDMANSVTQTELSSNAMQEAIAQAMYGMSKVQATSMLGVPANTTLGTRGYKNGQVDPTTGATYAYGQATDDDGSVSYGSIDDFGIGVAAMSATGFLGGMKAAERVAEKGKTKEARQKAKNYISFVKARTKQKEQAKKDEEATRGGTGDLGGIGDLGSGYGIGASTGAGSQTVGTEDTDPTGGGTSTGTSQGTSATGMSTDDGGLGGGGDQSSSDGSSSDAGGATEGVGDYNIGGLAGKKKKKPKPKKMKRGGLASKK